MKRFALSFLGTLIVVAIFGALNGYVSARYFVPSGYYGSAFLNLVSLIVGVLCAIWIGGYVGYRVPATGKLADKIGSGVCYAVVATALTLYFYLLIFVNIRGE